MVLHLFLGGCDGDDDNGGHTHIIIIYEVGEISGITRISRNNNRSLSIVAL